MAGNDVIIQRPAAPGKVRIRLRILDYHGKPLAKAKCTLDWGSSTIGEFTTDGDGILQADVPGGPRAPTFGSLTIPLSSGSDYTMDLLLSDVGPADQLPGARARLNNLGYLALTEKSNLRGPADDATTRAIERFQTANQLFDKGPRAADRKPTGAVDAVTGTRMEEAHDRDKGPLVKLLVP